jgi:hypothetical protein
MLFTSPGKSLDPIQTSGDLKGSGGQIAEPEFQTELPTAESGNPESSLEVRRQIAALVRLMEARRADKARVYALGADIDCVLLHHRACV